MKKTILTTITLGVLSFASMAQKTEGSVTYAMSIEGLPAEQAAMMGEMDSKVTFKNGKVLNEMNSMMFSNQTVINEAGMTMLMDQMGNKMAVTQTKQEMEKENSKAKKESDPKIEYTSETKTIAGYECKKAIITIEDKNKKEEKVDMWYCDQFANPNMEGRGRGQNIMKGLKGMPFEYSFASGPVKFKISAKEVSLAPVSDEKFKLSTEGYKLVTMEDLKALQGGK